MEGDATTHCLVDLGEAFSVMLECLTCGRVKLRLNGSTTDPVSTRFFKGRSTVYLLLASHSFASLNNLVSLNSFPAARAPA